MSAARAAARCFREVGCGKNKSSMTTASVTPSLRLPWAAPAGSHERHEELLLPPQLNCLLRPGPAADVALMSERDPKQDNLRQARPSPPADCSPTNSWGRRGLGTRTASTMLPLGSSCVLERWLAAARAWAATTGSTTVLRPTTLA